MLFVSFLIAKVFVTVDDHPKLSAPITKVIVGDDLVPQESKHMSDRSPDDRRTDMTDVHRFGYVR